MKQQNSQLSEEAQWRNSFINFVVFPAIIIIPILLSLLFSKILGQDNYLRAIAELGSGFGNTNFWSAETDTTHYLLVVGRIRPFLTFHSIICMAGGGILLSETIRYKKRP